MVQRTLLNLLRLLGTEHRWCGDPIVSVLFIIIRAQARKAQGPIVFVRILYLFFIFLTIRAFLRGLTWSKTLENVHTH